MKLVSGFLEGGLKYFLILPVAPGSESSQALKKIKDVHFLIYILIYELVHYSFFKILCVLIYSFIHLWSATDCIN